MITVNFFRADKITLLGSLTFNSIPEYLAQDISYWRNLYWPTAIWAGTTVSTDKQVEWMSVDGIWNEFKA